jgi:hypothetical protein
MLCPPPSSGDVRTARNERETPGRLDTVLYTDLSTFEVEPARIVVDP